MIELLLAEDQRSRLGRVCCLLVAGCSQKVVMQGRCRKIRVCACLKLRDVERKAPLICVAVCYYFRLGV